MKEGESRVSAKASSIRGASPSLSGHAEDPWMLVWAAWSPEQQRASTQPSFQGPPSPTQPHFPRGCPAMFTFSRLQLLCLLSLARLFKVDVVGLWGG